MGSDPSKHEWRSSWRTPSRRLLTWALLVALGMSIGASVRQSIPGSSHTTGHSPSPLAVPSSPSTTGRATRFPTGLSGSLLLLTGSASGLPGGPSGEIVWRIDLASGAIRMGPAESAQSTLEGATSPIGYPGFEGFSGPPPIVATSRQVIVYQPMGRTAFLVSAPVGGQDFGSIPLLAAGEVANYSLGAGRIAFVNDEQAQFQTTTIQQVGILGHPLAFQGRAPGLLLADAYALRGGLYAAAAEGTGHLPSGGRPVIARVSHGRLRVVLTGWQVLAEDPTGASLLVVRVPRFSPGQRGSRQAFLWHPGSAPRPLLPRAFSLGQVLAWSVGTVDELLVAGKFHGASGLFLAVPRGAVVPLMLPTGMDWSNVAFASFAGDNALFLTDGIGRPWACDVAARTCRVVQTTGTIAGLPVLALTWSSGP